MSHRRNLSFFISGLKILDLNFLCFILICLKLEKTDPQGIEGSITNQTEAIIFIDKTDKQASSDCNSLMESSWNYQTNITEFNRQKMLEIKLRVPAIRRKNWSEATRFRWRSFEADSLKRIFSIATVLGIAALPEEERVEYEELLQNMGETYHHAKICSYDPNRVSNKTFSTLPKKTFVRNDNDFRDYVFLEEEYQLQLQIARNDDANDYDDRTEDLCLPTLRLEPDLERIMAESRNPNELLYVWRAWREASGRPLRRQYLRLIRLSNRAARLNGFNTTKDFWQRDYESDNLEVELERIWDEIRPLYEQLHAYVRKKLKERYGDQYFSSVGTIPAHLLGNMWGQSWVNLLDITTPFANRSFQNITRKMVRQNYTPEKIYKTAENFYLSLGYNPLPESFWLGSMLVKPPDRKVSCYASTWDFCNGVDYRIKHCTQITLTDFITAHHELGHIYYAMAYKNLNHLFRFGANPGFHEAVSDAIALSVATPSHLAKIKLLTTDSSTYKDDINSLFATALGKIVVLPFALLTDKWRWKVFNKEIEFQDMNIYWWQLRVIYQGISPPVFRSPREFDPGSKYHISAHLPYLRYFFAYILKFQIHEELCLAAGHTGDLHKCDIYGSRAAGEKLQKLLRLGKSKPWKMALSDFTGGRINRLDAGPMLRYFRPLYDWLARENRRQKVGWYTNEALFTLTGGMVKTSSVTLIGILVGTLAILFVMGSLSFYCYTKFIIGRHSSQLLVD